MCACWIAPVLEHLKCPHNCSHIALLTPAKRKTNQSTSSHVKPVKIGKVRRCQSCLTASRRELTLFFCFDLIVKLDISDEFGDLQIPGRLDLLCPWFWTPSRCQHWKKMMMQRSIEGKLLCSGWRDQWRCGGRNATRFFRRVHTAISLSGASRLSILHSTWTSADSGKT